MDRHLPPRVTYWTGIWEPAREGISSEVEALRRSLSPGSPVLSIASGQSLELQARERVLRLGPQHYPLARLLAPVVEPWGDVSHVFGGLSEWHLLRAVGRRPVLFTVVIPGTRPSRELFERVSLFAVESESLAGDLKRLGVPDEQLRVTYPGVDLDRFNPAPPPAGRFRLLFASSPARVIEFDDRGIPLLVKLARVLPEVDFLVRWRNWGNAVEARAALAALGPPENFVVDTSRVADMASAFQEVHAVVLLFADGFGKSAPNSVIEGLACGRPALLSPGVGIAGLVEAGGAGLVRVRELGPLADAVHELRANWPALSQAARALAERHFDVRHFRQAYRALYSEVAGLG